MGELRERMKADLMLRNFRPSTQESYLSFAKKFAAYHKRSPEKMGKEDVREFLTHLVIKKNLSPSTVKCYIAALKFLYDITLDRPDVMLTFPMPRVPKKLPQILCGSEVEAILFSINKIKYRAVLMTAYGSGMRVGEACSLDIVDIDSKRMVIRIKNGKGGKERYSVLPKLLLKILREYFRQIRPPGPCLFPGATPDKPISRSSVRDVLHKVAKKCNITKRVTPHILRHSFATHLLETGNDIRVIQVLLGHQSINTTTVYAQVSAKHIARTKSPLDLLGTKEGKVLG